MTALPPPNNRLASAITELVDACRGVTTFSGMSRDAQLLAFATYLTFVLLVVFAA